MTAEPDQTYDPQAKPLYFFRATNPKFGFLSNWYASEPFTDFRLPSPSLQTATASELPETMKIYKTAEHYMMHHKALFFGDSVAAEKILAAEEPWEVQKLGRLVEGFDQEIWERKRMRIVTDAVYWKFTSPISLMGRASSAETPETVPREGSPAGGQGGKVREWSSSDRRNTPSIRAPSFRAALLVTGDRLLVEASPFDSTWGIGFSAEAAEAKRALWGLNLLGRCLMDVRKKFREEEEGSSKLKDESH